MRRSCRLSCLNVCRNDEGRSAHPRHIQEWELDWSSCSGQDSTALALLPASALSQSVECRGAASRWRAAKREACTPFDFGRDRQSRRCLYPQMPLKQTLREGRIPATTREPGNLPRQHIRPRAGCPGGSLRRCCLRDITFACVRHGLCP